MLGVLLASRKTGSDPAGLRHALWGAAWNCNPYAQQRPAADFEQCVQMLLAAGAPAEGGKDADNLVVAAVFTRNPGGNPKVIEMLVKAGADPNPPVSMQPGSKAHLLDAVGESCAQGGCSVPVAEVVIKAQRSGRPRWQGSCNDQVKRTVEAPF